MPLDPTDAATTTAAVGPVDPDIVNMRAAPTVEPAPAGSSAAPEIAAPSGNPAEGPGVPGAPTGGPTPPPKAGLGTGFRQGFMGRNYRVTGTGEVESGETTSPTFSSRLGTILGTVAMGALAGLGGVTKGGGRAGSLGSGYRAAQETLQRRDLIRRQQAQQQFENQNVAQEAKNKDLYYKAELHTMDLNAIKLAHDIDTAKREDPYKFEQLKNAATISSMAVEEQAKNLGLINERTYSDYASVPKADIDKFNKQKVKIVTLPDGTVKVWDRTFDARTTPNADDFEIRDLTGMGPDGKPQWKVVGNVKAGSGTAAQQEAELEKERQQLTAMAVQNATIEREKAQTEQARAGAEKERAETKLTDVQIENLKNLGVNVPANYQPVPNAFTMPAQQLQQELERQGVRVPSNFQALYAIAHYQAGLNTLPSRTYNRGGNLQMDSQTGLAYIRSFINPGFDQNNFDAVKGMEKEFASTRQGTAGGNLIAFNTATGHLGQLYDAATALRNGNIVALNAIANEIGVQAGDSPVPVFNAIRGALVGELGRTFKGAAPDIPEMNQILDTINSAQSPKQLQDVARTYAHLMLTKAGAQVAHYYAWTGELPPQTIDPQALKVYDRMGINVRDVLPAVGAERPQGQAGTNAPGATGEPTRGNTLPGQRMGEIPMLNRQGQVVGYSPDGGKTMRHVTPFQMPNQQQ